MKITKQDVDALNAVLKIEIETSDYESSVQKILKDYRKNANIPGFRKGHVPMGLIQKQYGNAVKADEINKLLQKSLNDYLVNEKLHILGNPLPRQNDNFDWNAEILPFEFELGLAPEIDVDFSKKNKITKYKISVDKELISKEVENLQKRYGSLKQQDKIADNSNVNVTFSNTENQIEKEYTLSVESLKNKKTFVGKKIGDTLEISSQKIFKDAQILANALGITKEEADELDVLLNVTINEISFTEPALLNQEFFDKVFGKDNVKTEKEFRDKIKADAESQFQVQADQQLLNSVTDYLVDNTKFDLPSDFLKRWLQTAGEKELTKEEAEEEYNNSEKGIRYQLIESKLLEENKELVVSAEELQNFARNYIKKQMAQFGMLNPSDAEVDGIVQNILKNEEEIKRIQNQLMGEKLLAFYKEKMTFKEKEISYEDFFKEVYETNKK